MSDDFIAFSRPDIGEDEISEVVDALRSGWLTTGPRTREFERRFAEYVGARHAIAVNSATAAMHLALEAMGLQPGDRVLVPSYTFTATAEVVRYLDADPVFVDVEPDTLNIYPAAVSEALNRDPDIKVVLPVHFAGQACDMGAILEICSRHGVRVLEDAAHALPATSGGRMVGTLGDATAFSFYATKTLAVGEGGMLTTNDDAIAERARVMRLHGINRDVFDRYSSTNPSWYYEVVAPGYKYNLTDLASAIGIHQLKRQGEMHARRQDIAYRYLEVFKDLPLTLPVVRDEDEIHAWHLFVILLDQEIDRNQFISDMFDHGVGTSVHFIPLHRHPYWRDRYGLVPESFPISDAAYVRCVSLPLYSAMSDAEVDRVVTAVEVSLSNQL